MLTTGHLLSVSPLWVDYVEMVMINQRPVLRPAHHHFGVVIVFRLPDQGRSFGDKNGKYPSEFGISGAQFLGLGMFALVADHKVAQRDFVLAGTGRRKICAARENS